MIVNAMWVTKCKAQGVRVSEDEFIVKNARQLLLMKERKPKSMVPNTVIAYGEEATERMPFDDSCKSFIYTFTLYSYTIL